MSVGLSPAYSALSASSPPGGAVGRARSGYFRRTIETSRGTWARGSGRDASSIRPPASAPRTPARVGELAKARARKRSEPGPAGNACEGPETTTVPPVNHQGGRVYITRPPPFKKSGRVFPGRASVFEEIEPIYRIKIIRFVSAKLSATKR